MSKTTKIIAGLGIVAGLGVAAMPAISHATQQSATGDAEVIVHVDPAIALEISGNNDFSPYNAIADITPDNTTFEWGSGQEAVEITEIAGTSSSDINMTQNQFIAGTTIGADPNGFASTLKVTTNDSGFTLNVAAKTAEDVNLVSGSNSISSISAKGALTAGDGKWGIQAADSYTGGTLATAAEEQWSPVSTTAAIIKTLSGSTTGYKQDVSIVNYGVATSVDQPVGNYQATLTYTATTAN